MAFSSRGWFPVAVLLGVLNLGAAWFYGRMEGSGLHATVHVIVAIGFGVWAARIRSRARSPATGELPAHLAFVEDQLEGLRQELIETQERLDFAERMLAQRNEPPREKVDREGRPGPE